MVTCSKVMESGFPCDAPRLSDSIYCRVHDDRPTTIRARTEASRRGGLAAHKPVPTVEGLAPNFSSGSAVLSTLERVAQALAEGKIDKQRATGIGYLATAANQALRIHAMEERLKRIEKRLSLNQSPLEDDEPEKDDVKG